MYYKNKENQPYYEPSQSIIERDELIKTTKKEFDKIVYEINNPPLTEDQRIQQINSKQDEIITKKDMYPIYKQLNIDNQLEPYTLDDKEIKNMFIETVRLIGRKAKENGTLVDDIDWAGLDKITEPSQITQDLILQAKKLLG